MLDLGRSIAFRQTPVSRFHILSFLSRVTPKAKGLKESVDEDAIETSCEGEEIADCCEAELRDLDEKDDTRERTEKELLDLSSVSRKLRPVTDITNIRG